MLENNKTILFGAPIDFGFSDIIKKELIKLGFNVIDFSFTGRNFYYKSILTRLHNCYRKVFFQDYQNKKLLLHKFHKDRLLEQLSVTPNANFALFIRPDAFPKEFIEKMTRKATKSIAYQWDGLERFPKVFDYIPSFDTFYAFDSKDLRLRNLKPITNFYLETDFKKATNLGAYYCGSFDKDRTKLLLKIKQALNFNNIQDSFYINVSDENSLEEIVSNGFNPLFNGINYLDNLKNTINSNIIIDIHNPVHEGLSFRIFESLGYDKKIITTNPSVKNYDFYDPCNIFVLDDNINDLSSFLSRPFNKVDREYKYKYSFENWINYMLGIEPNIPIHIPFEKLIKEEAELLSR